MKILPDEIPEDFAPLTDLPIVTPTDRLGDVLIEGENVFVSLLNGDVFVGCCEWVSDTNFTIGLSKPISRSLVESARVV